MGFGLKSVDMSVAEEFRPPEDDGEQAVIWVPQKGSQIAFLTCPVFEVLLEGPRGGGKTDVLLMDFAQHVGLGYGAEWRGILFRKTYVQLADVVAKTKKWYRRIFPHATFNEAKMQWAWPTGETLRLAYMERDDDYENYHGHAYPWIGWEELTTYASDVCYRSMMSCCRSSHPKIPRKYRGNTNPYGVGHGWVKLRFKLPIAPGERAGPVIKDPDSGVERVAIRAPYAENLALSTADPEYVKKTAEAARNPAQKAAWVEGSWDVVAGGVIDDLWEPRVHVVPDLAGTQIPLEWRLNRAYDHGQSAPFSVGWYAESNGEPITLPGGRLIGPVRGDVIRFAEWYGWSGKPNEGVRLLTDEIAAGIVSREKDWGLWGRVQPGPADSSIFDDNEGKTIAGTMARRGVQWRPADKGPGSRKQGWDQLRRLLAGALPGPEGRREKPGIFVCARCEQFIRTVPALPRSEKDPDDVDTHAEDHVGDEVRYRVRERYRQAGSQGW